MLVAAEDCRELGSGISSNRWWASEYFGRWLVLSEQRRGSADGVRIAAEETYDRTLGVRRLCPRNADRDLELPMVSGLLPMVAEVCPRMSEDVRAVSDRCPRIRIFGLGLVGWTPKMVLGSGFFHFILIKPY